jgi:membrane protease YdiL (CAAX protease family)
MRPVGRVSGQDAALALLPYVALIVATGVASAPFLPAGPRTTLLTTPAFGVSSTVGYVALILATRKVADATAAGREALGLRSTRLGPACRAVLAAALAAVVANLALEPVFHGGRAQGVTVADAPRGGVAILSLALAALVIVVLGPIAEELYFRGLILGVLAPLGPLLSVTISALLFAGTHFTLAAIPVIAVLGALFAIVRLRTDSIWPGVVLHGLNNGVALLLTFG